MRPLFFNYLLLIAGIILLILVVLFLGSTETYGAESNPTGNPIGGGSGYSGIITPDRCPA